MGGSGSTRWRNHGTLPALDAGPYLAVPFLRRLNLFNEILLPQSRRVKWSRSGYEIGSCVVAVTKERDAMTVTYSNRAGDYAPWVPVYHSVDLVRTPCWYGGSRLWFACPQCGRRCAVLALAGVDLGCRVCLRLAYSSQRAPLWKRRHYRLDRLGKVAPDWTRPRGMWHRTWARHCAEWNALVQADEDSFVARYVAQLREK